MGAYYNENDRHAAAWLRNLAAAGRITPGTVDDRSIKDVAADDVRHLRRCHFFAGIGGWDLALQLAGWPVDRPAWTGSCPCQPYSSAGSGRGDDDPRNLWPDFFRLIRECRPDVVLGEQVDRAIGHGWLDGISADLEGEGYAVGAAVLGAHSVGSPHIRSRLYWVANLRREGLEEREEQSPRDQLPSTQRARIARRLWDSEGFGRRQELSQLAGSPAGGRAAERIERPWGDFHVTACLDGRSRRVPHAESGILPLADGVPGRVGLLRGSGNAIVPQVAAEFIAAFLEMEVA